MYLRWDIRVPAYVNIIIPFLWSVAKLTSSAAGLYRYEKWQYDPNENSADKIKGYFNVSCCSYLRHMDFRH